MEFSEFKKLICSEFYKHIGIELSEKQCQMFFDYMNILISKNEVMNLTAITDPHEIIIRHFIDSSIPLKVFGIDYFNKKYVVDVGTGAGFPGLPLAILCRDTKIVLNDTLGKRIRFLQEVIEKIDIDNTILIKARVEDFDRDKLFREKFDIAFSRGVAKLSVLSEYCLPLVKIGGQMISFKMDNCDDELNDAKKAIKVLGGMFHVKHSYSIIEDEPQRCLVEILKKRKSPKQYPRKAGTPSKNPL